MLKWWHFHLLVIPGVIDFNAPLETVSSVLEKQIKEQDLFLPRENILQVFFHQADIKIWMQKTHLKFHIPASYNLISGWGHSFLNPYVLMNSDVCCGAHTSLRQGLKDNGGIKTCQPRPSNILTNYNTSKPKTSSFTENINGKYLLKKSTKTISFKSNHFIDLDLNQRP